MRGLTLWLTGQPMKPTIWVLPVMAGWVTLAIHSLPILDPCYLAA